MATNTFTVIDEYNQLCKRIGVEPDLIPNTTLNEHLGIISGDQGVARADGVMRYLGFGNGGHDVIVNGGATGLSSKERLGQYQGLYNILPMAMKLVNSDFTPAEAANYRMRRLEVHNGVSYYAYYLRKLDTASLQPTIYLETTENGVVTTTPYVHGIDALVHPDFTPASGSTSYRLIAELYLTLDLTANEVSEIQNACEILYGGTGFSVVSELGLYSGVDTNITADLNGATVSLSELANAQLVSSASTGRLLDFSVGSDLTNMRVGRAFSYTP